MPNLDAVISDIEFGRAEVFKAIEGLSESQLTTVPIYEGWTIKDVLAHLIGWDEWVLRTVPLIVQDRADEIPRIAPDSFNGLAIATWRPKSLAEVIAALQKSLQQVVELFSILDYLQIDLRRQRKGKIITIRSYVVDLMVEHERQHVAEIRQWRVALGVPDP
jgi:uncharacterized damage-inducible protein DinB